MTNRREFIKKTAVGAAGRSTFSDAPPGSRGSSSAAVPGGTASATSLVGGAGASVAAEVVVGAICATSSPAASTVAAPSLVSAKVTTAMTVARTKALIAPHTPQPLAAPCWSAVCDMIVPLDRFGAVEGLRTRVVETLCRVRGVPVYSTVTDFARLRGWSMS